MIYRTQVYLDGFEDWFYRAWDEMAAKHECCKSRPKLTRDPNCLGPSLAGPQYGIVYDPIIYLEWDDGKEAQEGREKAQEVRA